jgi:hypothetical protein
MTTPTAKVAASKNVRTFFMITPEFHFVSNASSALSELGKSRDYILYLPNFAMAPSRRR